MDLSEGNYAMSCLKLGFTNSVVNVHDDEVKGDFKLPAAEDPTAPPIQYEVKVGFLNRGASREQKFSSAYLTRTWVSLRWSCRAESHEHQEAQRVHREDFSGEIQPCVRI